MKSFFFNDATYVDRGNHPGRLEFTFGENCSTQPAREAAHD